MTIYKSLKKVGLLLAALALAGCASTSADARFLRIKGSASAPVNMVPPTQTGIPRENDTLTCATNPSDWVFDGGIYTYQRYRDDVSTPIGGATSAAYTAVTADVGHTVICRAGNTNIAGTGYGYSLASDIVSSATLLLPATQTVSFGVKTPVGYGGDKLGYIGTSYVGVTGGTSGCDTKFTTNIYNELVPKNGSAAYGTVAPVYGGVGTCTVTLAEYTGRSGSFPSYSFSGETGVTGTVNLTLLPNAFTIAVNDANDGTSPSEVNQLSKIIASGNKVSFGDTIYLRDGNYAAIPGSLSSSRWRLKKSSTEFVGTPPTQPYDANFVTIRSENVSGITGPLGTDVSAATFGAKVRLIDLLAGTNPNMYLRFKYIEFSRLPAGGTNTSTNNSPFGYSDNGTVAGTVNWVQLDHTRLIGQTSDGATLATSGNGSTGVLFRNTGSLKHIYIMDNYFDNFFNTLTFTGDDLQIIGNTIRRQQNDNKVQITAKDATVGGTFAFNFIKDRGIVAHSDDLQEDLSKISDAGAIPGGVYPAINIIGNISTVGNRATGGSGQGAPFQNGWHASSVSQPTSHSVELYAVNKRIYGNITFSTQGNSMYLTNQLSLSVKYNLNLWPFDGLPFIAYPNLVSNGGNTVSTFGKNIVSGSVSAAFGDTSSVSSIHSTADATNNAICGLTGPTLGTNLVEKADIIAAVTPQIGSYCAVNGIGPVGSGVDYINQTAVFNDGFTYVRPVPN